MKMKNKLAASLLLACGLISNAVAQTTETITTTVAKAPVVIVTNTNEPPLVIIDPDESLARMKAQREALDGIRLLLATCVESYDPTRSARELITQLRNAHTQLLGQFERALKEVPVPATSKSAIETKPSVNTPSEVTRPTAEDKPVTKPVEKPAEKPAQVPQDKDDQ